MTWALDASGQTEAFSTRSTLAALRGVRATTRCSAAGGAAWGASSVTPKCEKAAADECSTTAATISVNVDMGRPQGFRRALVYGTAGRTARHDNVKSLS